MKLSKFTYACLFLIFLSIFFKLFFIHPTFSDENFYFNVAKNILEGKTPYKDFFFAHPPLQVYTIALFFNLFGITFFVGKMLTLISSSICALLIYFILKELYNSKSGFIAFLIFLVSVPFIAFSIQGYGMWEASMFILLSIYLILKDKLMESGFTFVIAILFRYFSLLYLPFLLILIFLKNYKIKKFLIQFLTVSIILSFILILIFGENIINDTITYQIKNLGVSKTSESYFTFQYLSIGFFLIFLGLISVIYAYIQKDKILILLSLYPLLTDALIFFTFKEIAYHYFLLNLPLYTIAIGRVFTICKDKIVQIAIFMIIVLSIITNFQTIDFYLNPIYSERYYYITNFIENKTSISDSIFGEPVITNYVSFLTNRRISSYYLDSYMRHFIFEGEDSVIINLEKDKPKIFIDMDTYYFSNPYFKDFMTENYVFENKFEGIPNYSIYILSQK